MLKFESWVPAAAKKYLESRLAENERELAGPPAAEKRRTVLEEDTACLRRLAADLRAREAYDRLKDTFNDAQWHDFLEAAVTARMDYAAYRKRTKDAADLTQEIADTASDLARLLRKARTVNAAWPMELFSVAALLHKTDGDEPRIDNQRSWAATRKHVLGDHVTTRIRNILPEDPDKLGPILDLRNIWEAAPPVAALVETVAKTAGAFKPRECGAAGAALSGRQSSARREYIRAYANLLEYRQISLTPLIMQAMASIGSAVIDAVNLSLDDVRKTLGTSQQG